ncbi:hypothetical protein PIB30_080707 [Stylosanthes scabra]|uniref:Uncharacterized protein n=1 Tax=Stylosanthes scabra TaxID=79078 RepID=A0ABU6VR49_9FABA|nr:hypothetical protein [Stylosanthes scabra]
MYALALKGKTSPKLLTSHSIDLITRADWVRHKDGRPHYLRRSDLEPMTKENINVEEIIADQIYKFVYKTDVSSSLPFPSIIAALYANAKIPAIPDDTLIPQEPPIVGVAMTRTREARARNPMQARQATLPNKNHLKSNHNPNSTINKISLQTSTLTSMPLCPKSIGGLTNNKKRIGRALRPSTQE